MRSGGDCVRLYLICFPYDTVFVLYAFESGVTMNLALFGANGGTGRLLARQAAQAGHHVTAVTRHPETFPFEHENLRLVAGDVRDPAAVEVAVSGADAVI